MKRAILATVMTVMFITGCGKSSTYAVTTKVVEVDAAKRHGDSGNIHWTPV